MAQGPLDAGGEPLSNSALIEAMSSVARSDTPGTRAMLFRLLLDSTLLAVTPEVPEEPRTYTAEAGDTLRLVTLSDAEGSVLPLFTSPGAVTRWRPEGAGYVALPARALFQMAASGDNDKVALDPGSAVTGFIPRHEIEALARGRLPLGETEVVAEPARVLIGQPKVPPPADALDALRASLAAEPLARRAWYFLMVQGPGEPELCVAVEFAPGSDPEHRGRAMRGLIDRAGWRAPALGRFVFVVADEGWQARLAGGAGVELFAR